MKKSKQVKYSVGFMFNEDKTQVALVRKTRPEWQAGKLNGPGGKVESGETYDQTMSREFEEEVGGETNPEDWNLFMVMSGKDFIIHFFTMVGDLTKLLTVGDEELVIEDVKNIHLARADMIDNLPWTVGMALDHIVDTRPEIAMVVYL